MTEPTPRQLAVLIAWIECGTAEKAGRQLRCHPNTVRHVLADLAEALGAKGSAQAFAIAVKRGLIDPHELRIDNAA